MGKVLTKTMSEQSLSPAAQAVMDAYLTSPMHNDHRIADMLGVAAALRVVADQVTPTTVDPRVSTIRFQIMRIARELEGGANV